MKFLNWAQVSRTWACKHKEWRIGITVTIVVLIAFHLIWRGGLGFGPGELVTGTIEREVRDSQGKPAKDAQGNLIKETQEITINIPAKSTWDLLSLIGVPSALVILGYGLQQQQQKQAEAADKKRREIAADEAREEVIQTYFDRLSALLVNENLLAIAAKIHGPLVSKTGILSQERATLREQELFEAAVDVIRARTLSILRRLENDTDRKTSVIRFLIDAEVISKAKLSLQGADLSGVNLQMANLQRANLKKAIFRGADLRWANLQGASLEEAILERADLKYAVLRGAKLWIARLEGANLATADLQGASLRQACLQQACLEGAQLEKANLWKAQLQGASLRDADLSLADLRWSSLRDANLSRANLRWANLRNADLNGAVFDKVNLRGGDLCGAVLNEVNLSRSNLSEARGLTQDQLTHAKLCSTKLPYQLPLLDPNRDCKELGIDPETGKPLP